MPDNNPDMTNSRDSVMIRLLDACVGVLKDQNKTKMFIDAVTGGSEGFRSMGKETFASR
jgi:hypothetical protein